MISECYKFTAICKGPIFDSIVNKLGSALASKIRYEIIYFALFSTARWRKVLPYYYKYLFMSKIAGFSLVSCYPEHILRMSMNSNS